jgi:leader peptidase (prepilin peptidase) / N-methyltransferase
VARAAYWAFMDALGWLTIVAAALVGLGAGRYVAVAIAWVPARADLTDEADGPARADLTDEADGLTGADLADAPDTVQATDGGERRLPPVRCPHGVAALAGGGRAGTGRVWGGGCPGCAGRLGGWGVAAELATAGVLAGLAASVGPKPVLPAFCYFGVLAVALAFIDARSQRLPDFLTLPSYPVALILLAVAATATSGGGRRILDALVGMAAAWLLFFAQALIYPAGIGWGDVKLSGLVGMYLGWLGVGWLGLGALAAGLFLGYLLAASAGVVLLGTRRATAKTRLAFGPFLLAGTLAVIVIYSLDGARFTP